MACTRFRVVGGGDCGGGGWPAFGKGRGLGCQLLLAMLERASLSESPEMSMSGASAGIGSLSSRGESMACTRFRVGGGDRGGGGWPAFA